MRPSRRPDERAPGPGALVSRRLIVEADGGSRGNPGPSAYGAVLKDAATGETIAERGETIGVATNNVAEYEALVHGLRLAKELGITRILCFGNSDLVVQQVSGDWDAKDANMASYRFLVQ